MREFSEDQLSWYCAIGYLATRWAAVEILLDRMVEAVHDNYSGDKIEPERPRALNRKGPYLRKAFKAHHELLPFYDHLDQDLHEVSALSDKRHWVIHGTMLSHPELTGNLATFIKYSWRSDQSPNSKGISIEDIYETADDALTLSLNLLFLGIQALNIGSKDEIDKILSELTGEDITIFPLG
ncbi:hypothetical protein [Roseibium sp.]|uniref:hypothetical protein n=1 Tax=Roseibium sp. TaxID=1936156 RepID=UPI003B51A6AC